MRKILCMILALTLIFALAVPAAASDTGYNASNVNSTTTSKSDNVALSYSIAEKYTIVIPAKTEATTLSTDSWTSLGEISITDTALKEKTVLTVTVKGSGTNDEFTLVNADDSSTLGYSFGTQTTNAAGTPSDVSAKGEIFAVKGSEGGNDSKTVYGFAKMNTVAATANAGSYTGNITFTVTYSTASTT